MIDTKSLFDQFVGSGVAGGLAGGIAGGALANALSGKKAKKFAGSALQLGGLALVGGLAYKAWQNHQQRAQSHSVTGTVAPAPTVRGAFLPDANDKAGADALSLLLVRAVISAAKADGQIDTREGQEILNRINSLDLPVSDKAALFEEYGKPLDVAGLAAAVDSPEHAAEVYAVSLLTVDPASPSEQIYLDTLARALGLDTGLIGEIHATVQSERAAA